MSLATMLSLIIAAASIGHAQAGAHATPKRALVLVDVQDCFTTGGTLAVNNAEAIIPEINKIRASKDCLFDIVVRSQDFHPAGHISFGTANGVTMAADGSSAGAPIDMQCINPTSGATADAACCPDPEGNLGAFGADKAAIQANMASMKAAGNMACTTCFDDTTKSQCFKMAQAMWPDHCLQNGDSTFPTNLTVKSTDKVMQKGSNKWVDAYSAFMDNTKSLKTPLDALLKQHGITEIYMGGIATDFCVKWTAEDARLLNYSVTVIQGAMAGINIGGTTVANALSSMASVGVKTVTVADVLAMNCSTGTSVSSNAWVRLPSLSLMVLPVVAMIM